MVPNRNPAARLYAPVEHQHRPQVTPPVEQGKVVVLSHIFSPPAWVGVGAWWRYLVFPLLRRGWLSRRLMVPAKTFPPQGEIYEKGQKTTPANRSPGWFW